VIDDLVIGRIGEAEELDLGHGAHTGNRHPESGSDDPRLGHRSIENPTTPMTLEQPVGDSEHTTGTPDVLSQEHDALVDLECGVKSPIERLCQVDLSHHRPFARVAL